MMIQRDSIARFCAAALLVIAGPVAAQTPSEAMAFCDTAGEIALATTAARDAGVPLDQAQGLGEQFEMNQVAKDVILNLISLIYVMEGVEGPLMQQVAIQICQKNFGLKE